MKLGFSHEPAVWIGVIAAILEAVLVSNLISMPPEIKASLIALVPIVAGALIRLFVTPNVTVADASKPIAPLP